MRQKIEEEIQIPEGITCELENKTLICKKDSYSISRDFSKSNVSISLSENKIILKCEKANKKQFKVLKSISAHIKNMFKGLNSPFVYKLEICHVHFPMNIKVDKDQLIISNFLGEQKPRIAKIVPGVKVEIKGQNIILSSPEIEKAGQTATNIEKATKISKRDRRIFQDGIFIVEKPLRRENEN